MLTVNIDNEETGHVKSTDPQRVEIYIGAMDDYEHYDIGGVHWKFPLGMVEELTTQYLKKHGRVFL